MTNYCYPKTSFIAAFISLVTGLLFFIPTAQAQSIQSITFRVPMNVTNIHPDIMYLAPMCRIFTGDVASNANQLGAVRPDIAIPASREVSQKVTMTVTKANLSPGKTLDDTTLYSCVLYVKKSATGPLLNYSMSSQDPATRAAGSAPRNIVMGAIVPGREKAIAINTPMLSAKGASAPGSTLAAAPELRRIEGAGRTTAATIQKPRGVNQNGAQAVTPNVGFAVDRRAQGPEPVVTSWSPQEIAYPGQKLIIEGRDFKPGSFVIQLQGEENRAINLKITNATPTRIEAQITDFDYTGYDGAKLVAFQRGGKRKILDENYKIVEADIKFKGQSLWRAGTLESDNIFTIGEVTLTLENFEFSESGSGIYEEVVELVGPVKQYDEPCKGTFFEKGKRRIIELDFREKRLRTDVQWRKLSGGQILIDGIYDAGVLTETGSYTGIGMLDDDIFTLSYNVFGHGSRATTVRDDCRDTIEAAVNEELSKFIIAELPPLAYKRLIQWSLVRTTP